mgnify:CR=1 FL=1
MQYSSNSEGVVRNVIKGNKYKKNGTEYNEGYQKRIFTSLKRLSTRNQFVLQMLDECKGDGNEELYKALFGKPVTTLTGRVRGKVGFTQACNTPFSGLASDGAKLAMWNLYMSGYNIIAFIHDEIVIEIPETSSGIYDEEADHVKMIMNGSMQELTGPIPIGSSFTISKVWSKSAQQVRDELGRLRCWTHEGDPTK